MHNADSLLLSYLHSTDVSERKRLEDELLRKYAAPLVQRTLQRRLRFYVDQSGGNPNFTDAADIYQEAMLRPFQKLKELRSQRDANHINNFDQHVARIAINT